MTRISLHLFIIQLSSRQLNAVYEYLSFCVSPLSPVYPVFISSSLFRTSTGAFELFHEYETNLISSSPNGSRSKGVAIVTLRSAFTHSLTNAYSKPEYFVCWASRCTLILSLTSFSLPAVYWLLENLGCKYSSNKKKRL